MEMISGQRYRVEGSMAAEIDTRTTLLNWRTR